MKSSIRKKKILSSFAVTISGVSSNTSNFFSIFSTSVKITPFSFFFLSSSLLFLLSEKKEGKIRKIK